MSYEDRKPSSTYIHLFVKSPHQIVSSGKPALTVPIWDMHGVCTPIVGSHFFNITQARQLAASNKMIAENTPEVLEDCISGIYKVKKIRSYSIRLTDH